MSGYSITQLPASLWQKYKEIRLKALQTDSQAFLSAYKDETLFPDEKWQKRLDKVGQGQSWVYFAKNLEDEIVGMVGAYRNEEFLKTHKAEIWGVYVVPEERGKSVANLLMQKIIDVLSSDPNIEVIVLEVNTDQEIAKSLYEKFGFRLVSTRDLALGDGVKHKVSLMERDIITK